MSETKEITSGMVTSITDADLVMCAVNGVYHPVTAKNLDKSLKKASGTSVDTSVTVEKNVWIRVAKCSVMFSGIISVLGSYNGSEVPFPAFIALGGYGATWANPQAHWINKSASYVSAVRFVKEGSDYFVEVKSNKDKSNTIYVRLSLEYNISLIPATISNADTSNVLKTIEFAGGG